MCSFMMQVGVGADGGSDGMGLQPSWSAGKDSDSGHRHQTAILSPLKKRTRWFLAPGSGELPALSSEKDTHAGRIPRMIPLGGFLARKGRNGGGSMRWKGLWTLASLIGWKRKTGGEGEKPRHV